jgi:hypothetical protein
MKRVSVISERVSVTSDGRNIKRGRSHSENTKKKILELIILTILAVGYLAFKLGLYYYIYCTDQCRKRPPEKKKASPNP